jgi:hypothetical protein
VGIEHLTVEFPNVQYAGHNQWRGYYGIAFVQVAHSWIRHVTVTDADRGIELTLHSNNNTVSHVTLKTKWRQASANPTGEGTTGHYGFAFTAFAQDNLITESELQTIYDHNLDVASFANGNVYASILSQSGRFDHHAGAPYENLFTEIVLSTTATDLLKSGGNRVDEPNSGMHTTLWNVSTLAGGFPPRFRAEKFPRINMIGLDYMPTSKTSDQEWIERWLGPLTHPANLYQAQLQHRLENMPNPVAMAVVQLWLEAEHGQGLSAPMRVEATPEASGGQYVWVPERTGNLTDASAPGGEALYQFTAPVTGTYVVWGQVSAPSTASDSFFVAMDEAPYFVWGLPRDASGAWQWAALSEAGSKQAVRFELAAGEHTLRVKQREDGAKLDRLVLTNDVDFIP